jgi:undecaprenyl-diphosphatase
MGTIPSFSLRPKTEEHNNIFIQWFIRMQELTITNALILGLLQGFTEWLPISSSGHLVIAQSLMGIEVPAQFDIVIMLGTIAALILYFRTRLISLFMDLSKGDAAAIRYLVFIIIAGIGTAVIGFSGKHFFTGLYDQPFIVCLFLVLTGIFLYIASRTTIHDKELSNKSAFLIGVAQGIAVAPGISRSGSTVGTALLLGIHPREAAEFSFIIGIPAMLVATLITLYETPMGGVPVDSLIMAVAASFVAGYASIGIFMLLFEKNRLDIFAYYLIIAGSVFALLIMVQ